MNWLAELRRYRDERHELIQLRHQLDALDEGLQENIKGLSPHGEEYNFILSQFFFEHDTVRAAIAQIETAQMKRRAERWRIPLPPRPYKEAELSDFWEWHDPHGRCYFSEKGMSQLRRDIYLEWEMWWKPWLSWAAISISVLSLAISFYRA